MSFLYPSFLFGLLAVSIPILIHLFNLQRPKKILFSNVRFLKQVEQTTTSKLKLKHLLILLSRILFIVFLVLAFAQPFIASNNATMLSGKPSISLYLDNSYSMQNEVGGEHALDIAVKSIAKISDVYSPSARYNLLTNDFEGKDQFNRNKDKLNERLTEINNSGTFRSIDAVFKRQNQLMDNIDAASKQVFIFSDFQKSTCGDLSKINFDTTKQYYLVPLQSKEVANIFIDSLWLSSPLIKVGENNSIEASLYNDGSKPIKNLVLKLFIENVQVSTAAINIEAGSYASVALKFNINKPGQQRCVIRFDDYPVTFDNEYYFILNVAPKIKILHLYDGDGLYIKKVYGNESVFTLQSNKVGDFDYSLITTSNLIVFDNIKDIPTALDAPLKDFVNNGGSLFIYPSAESNIESYNNLGKQLSLPVLQKQKTDTTGNKITYEMFPPDYKNPFFSNVFEKVDGNILMPYAFPAISWGRGGESILVLKTNDPFISLFVTGKGKVYLAGSPLSNSTTNFPQHSIFVPVMYKTAFNSVQESEQLSFSFQEPAISIDMEITDNTAVYSLESENFSIIPAQRILGSRLMMELPRDEMKAGFYKVKYKDQLVKWIALNYGKEESYLDFYDTGYLRKLTEGKKNVQVFESGESDDFVDNFKKENMGISLWKYCLILSLIFLLIEILLIRFL